MRVNWTEFYKYAKRHNRKRENIPAIKDCNGWLNTEKIEKANSQFLLFFGI